MPVVNGKITRPDLAKQSASVEFELVDQFGTPVRAWKSATDETIISRQPVTLDPSTGAYTITIPGNTDLNPANTRWRRRIYFGQDIYTDYLVVPPSGGPYQEEDIAQDIVALPTTTPSNESSFFSLGASSSALTVTTGFVLLPVPTFVVTIPDSARPHIFLGAINMKHATVASATLWAAICVVGDTAIANAKGIGQATAAAANSTVTASFVGRVPAHSAGSYQVMVNGPAGDITVIGGSNGISVVEALAV